MLIRLLFFLALLLPSVSHAATFWDDEMESGSSGYDITGLSGMSYDTGTKYSGSGSLLLTYPAICATEPTPCGGFTDRTFTATDDLWGRFYIRLSSGFVTTNHTKVMRNDTNSVLMHWWGMMNGNRILMLQLQNYPVTGWTTNMQPNEGTGVLPENAWVCVETRIKNNTVGQADGIVEAYIEGERFMYHPNLEIRKTSQGTQNAQFVSNRLFRQSGTGSIWYDRVAFGSTRIGCLGSSSDITAPAQVTGLTAASNTSSSITYTWTANTETDLQQYVIQGCTPGACTNFATVGTSLTNAFTWTGRSANTLYRLKVAAQDNAGNVGTFSSIVDDTTDAASVLPTVTGFTTTATGGTITYTGSPTDFRIAFGGTNGDGTFWNSQIIRTLAQVPAGALSFNWPAGTSWACAHARDAVAAEDAVAYSCAGVTPAAPGSTPSGTYLRKLSSNPRWLTLDGSTAIYRVGISGGTNCNASFCGLQDIQRADFSNLIVSPTYSHTFDGTTTDLGTTWSSGYVTYPRLDINSGVVRPSAIGSDNSETTSTLFNDDQYAQVTIGTFNDVGFGKVVLLVNYTAPTTDTGYQCRAKRNSGLGQTSDISRNDGAGVSTVIANESATTWATGNMLRCRKVANTIYLDRSTDSGANWTNLLNVTDATYRGGRVGMTMYATTAVTNITADNFVAGNIIADYVTNLDAIVADGSNWVRYWILEQSAWCSDATCAANTHLRIPFTQFPWTWTGTTRTDTSTGTSIEVGVYDLNALNQPFFDRVSTRIDAALSRGITPIITMFSGGHLYYGLPTTWNAGFSNPFYSGNNINGISCDTNANEACEETHSITTDINGYQKAYINRLVQTIGNRAVILEVSNEDQTDSTDWQNMVMEQVRTAESTYGTVAHVIFQSGWGNSTYYPGGFANSDHLFNNTRNDAIAPLCTSDGTNWDTNPPANDGSKLIFSDSDHTGYADTCGTWTAIVPWKLFTRAIYPIFLSERESGAVQTAIKTAMAQTAAYSTKINLATAYPETGTSIFSTGYGLFTGTDASTPNCSEYIMLMPSDGSSTINLTACSAGATYNVTYLNLTSGAETSGGTTTGGASRAFNPAGSDPMVVLLKLDSVTDVTAPVIISCTTSPAGVLPAGTTSVDINCVTDEAATVKMDPTFGTAYASMATTFGTTGTTAHSQSVGSLADDTSYTRYVRASDGTNPTTTDYVVSWSVAAAAVSTAPDDVTNVRGTLDEAAGTILWQWDAATGADHYLIEISAGEVFLVAVESASAATFYQQGSLTANSSYNARVKAINTANQESVNWGQSVAVNTSLPPQVTGLTEPNPGTYSNTVILSWDAPTNTSLVSAVERCTGAACTTFAYHGGGSTTGYTDSTVSADTTYCYRVKFSNPVFGGTSASWSDTVCATTRSAAATGAGLIRPRTQLPYGVNRLPRN